MEWLTLFIYILIIFFNIFFDKFIPVSYTHLYPDAYYDLVEKVALRKTERDTYIQG